MLLVSWEKLVRLGHRCGNLESLELRTGNLFVQKQVLDLVFNHRSRFLLRVRVVENRRSVLGALVVALHVESGRVVKGEKESTKLLIAHLLRIKS